MQENCEHRRMSATIMDSHNICLHAMWHLPDSYKVHESDVQASTRLILELLSRFMTDNDKCAY